MRDVCSHGMMPQYRAVAASMSWHLSWRGGCRTRRRSIEGGSVLIRCHGDLKDFRDFCESNRERCMISMLRARRRQIASLQHPSAKSRATGGLQKSVVKVMGYRTYMSPALCLSSVVVGWVAVVCSDNTMCTSKGSLSQRYLRRHREEWNCRSNASQAPHYTCNRLPPWSDPIDTPPCCRACRVCRLGLSSAAAV